MARVERVPELYWADGFVFTIIGELVYCTVRCGGQTIIIESTVAIIKRGAAAWAAALARHCIRKGAEIIRFPRAKPPPVH